MSRNKTTEYNRFPRITDENILRQLQDYVHRYKEIPTPGAWEKKQAKLNYTSTGTIYRRFGSWENALRRAGLIPPEPNSNVTDVDDIINEERI